jgi:outer membrane protein OmpU
MKKVLFASTALVLSAGVAAADVTVGGSGRMGVVEDFAGDVSFTSRIRIEFNAAGETDGGLEFGGSIRADNAGGGNGGTAGSVFIRGEFGTLTMGDVSGAPEAAVGDVNAVGLTGLGDFSDATYLSNSNNSVRPALRYDYVIGGFGIHISADNPSGTPAVAALPGLAGEDAAYGIAVTYGAEMGTVEYNVGLGYETTGSLDHIILGGSVTVDAFTVAANYGQLDTPGGDLDQWAIGVGYTFDAITIDAFYSDNEIRAAVGAATESVAYGIGATYDLGGAALEGGWVRNDTTGNDSMDFGIRFSF